MRVNARTAVTALAVATATTLAGLALAAPAGAATPVVIGSVHHGTATYYNDADTGACGTALNAASQNLVAVSPVYWTTANPNNDPVCGLKVQVTFQGKSLTVPVRDKCPSCAAGHIDLSQPAFAQLAALAKGVITVDWKFVK